MENLLISVTYYKLVFCYIYEYLTQVIANWKERGKQTIRNKEDSNRNDTSHP
jgi:hypothetical protein